MQDEHPQFEIARLDGNTLILRKRGGTWKYEMRPDEIARHISPSKRAHMEEKQKEGWNILGIATMDRIGEKGLRLREVIL